MRRRDDLLERDDLLALGVGKDERGVEVRLLDRFVAHLQAVDELDVDELLHLAEYQADLLLVDALGGFGRGLDGRDAVDEQLGLLEDDERLLSYSSDPTVMLAISEMS